MTNVGEKLIGNEKRDEIRTKLLNIIGENPGIQRWKLMEMMLPYPTHLVSHVLHVEVTEHTVRQSNFMIRPDAATTYALKSAFAESGEAEKQD